jgi:ribosomal-protein-alanine N-acetyltransferase
MAALTIRRMTLADLPGVREVERVAFDAGWPPTTFEHELQHNGAARYLVLREGERTVAFGGLWLQFDQAHIVTVAVDPPERGRGLGRLVVHGLVAVASEMAMADATLEVRESNAAARALYRNYGFYEVGRRKRYYADNGEDAVIMTTEPLASGPYIERLARLAEELRARFGEDVVAQLDGEKLAGSG